MSHRTSERRRLQQRLARNLTATAEGRRHADASGCRDLAARVIEDAFDDVKKRRFNRCYKWHWKHAYAWIMSKDFDWWCDIVDYNASYFRREIRQIVENNNRRICQ